ncbi:hypothetical protein BPOR_0300g00070 [Botrytis porri]|uniref:Uncharacterized protein n=1 Tax=Botrytis porri TaxID=87229 RepID=A0A4Z1KLM1_9HELO|nr:hypothetical protein BPOR_0300g00070 [Botrytis porri]
MAIEKYHNKAESRSDGTVKNITKPIHKEIDTTNHDIMVFDCSIHELYQRELSDPYFLLALGLRRLNSRSLSLGYCLFSRLSQIDMQLWTQRAGYLFDARHAEIGGTVRKERHWKEDW